MLYVTRVRGAVGTWRSPQQVAPAIVTVDRADGSWEVVAGIRERQVHAHTEGPLRWADEALCFTDPDDFMPL